MDKSPIVCLLLSLYSMVVNAQFGYPGLDYRSTKKMMDEGFEFFRESPSFMQRAFSPQPMTSRYFGSHLDTAYNVQPMKERVPAEPTPPEPTAPNTNFHYGGNSIFLSRGFMDEGFEHVREFGGYGGMQSLMNNPSLFYGSLFL